MLPNDRTPSTTLAREMDSLSGVDHHNQAFCFTSFSYSSDSIMFCPRKIRHPRRSEWFPLPWIHLLCFELNFKTNRISPALSPSNPRKGPALSLPNPSKGRRIDRCFVCLLSLSSPEFPDKDIWIYITWILNHFPIFFRARNILHGKNPINTGAEWGKILDAFETLLNSGVSRAHIL